MEPNQPQPTEVPSAANTDVNSIQPVIVTPTASASWPLDAASAPGTGDRVEATVIPAQATTVAPIAEVPVSTVIQPSINPAGSVQPLFMPDSAIPPALSSGMVAPPPKNSRFAGNKKRWILVGGVIAVLGLTAGVVFGWYLPNTPGNVWSTGMNRSGGALDNFVQTALADKQLQKYKTSTIAGTVTAHYGGAAYDGSFNTTFDAANMNGDLNFSVQPKTGAKKVIATKVMSQTAASKLYPDVYVQVSGLSTLGLDAFAPGIASYDGQWMLISSSYLQSLSSDALGGITGSSSSASASDVATLVRTASSVSKDYLFTTKSDKAVFIKKAFVGKETLDGRSVYHYTVGVSSAHAHDYCVALANALVSTKAYQRISGKSGSQLDSAKQSLSQTCTSDTADAVASNDTADMWVDGHYKLIDKIRVYDGNDQNSYTDIGQVYTGGNAVSLFVGSHDGAAQSDAKFTLAANLNTNATKATFTTKNSSTSPYDATVTLALNPASKPVTVTKPASATSVQTLLGGLGIGGTSAPAPNTGSSTTSSSSSTSASSSSSSTSTSTQDNTASVDEADIGQASQTDDTAS